LLKKSKYDGKEVNNEILKSLADATSVDFAAAYFIYRIGLNKKHHALQQQFNAFVSGNKPSTYDYSNYIFLFVPGLLYKSKPETKGDLKGPRNLLNKNGFRTALVNIKEAGTVEENGFIIAGSIKKYNSFNVVIVSTSKGGPDVAYALGSVLNESELMHVKGWVSVGGALKGSPLVEKAAEFPDNLLLAAYGIYKGFNAGCVIHSMSVKQSMKRFNEQSIPKHIYVLHYIGVPFSGSVIPQVRQAYNYMRNFGPNDGVVLFSDEILENGNVVLAIGYDHWFRDPNIDIKTLSLTYTLLKQISKKTGN